ncbi:MAG TPA: coproporphyrinogen-III oxidase family protein [Candidatus Acidoferrales bacterium]|nr:coproporphyrinogen-III oxidase family protein [Candidatus Acidoferrales bacterium]
MTEGANTLLSEETTAGNYFISNYPPYSFWNPELVSQAHDALDRPPRPDAALGIYVHIPFCRKRCHFCYFKVYTGKDSDEIDRYLDAVVQELTLYSEKRFIGGRKPSFIYFGGGTPSFLSTRQLSRIVDAMKRSLAWDQAEEIAFECEPGTITEGKLEILKQMGVTRLSLGIENFDDGILDANGRAHGSKEIAASYQFARAIGFSQINIDLIAGMVGETEENWRECVRKTIAMDPDSVTVYQMEVPYNTTMSKEMRVLGQGVAPVANWPTKRHWVGYAFSEMEKAGYTIASAYTAVKDPRTRFLYRDLLWTGADMIGLGVASFSHVNGTHYQNEHDWDPYIDRVHQGMLPIYRALTPTGEECMIREFILQMKLGHVHREYFQRKFGVDVRQRFAASLDHLKDGGFLQTDTENLQLNRSGLLQVDRLLWEFFLPQHRSTRYS